MNQNHSSWSVVAIVFTIFPLLIFLFVANFVVWFRLDAAIRRLRSEVRRQAPEVYDRVFGLSQAQLLAERRKPLRRAKEFSAGDELDEVPVIREKKARCYEAIINYERSWKRCALGFIFAIVLFGLLMEMDMIFPSL